MIINSLTVDNLFVTSAVLAPILVLYSAGGVSLALIMIIVSSFLFIIKGNCSVRLLPYCFLLGVVVILHLLGASISVVFRTFQYELLLILPFLVYDKSGGLCSKCVSLYRNIALICSLFLIFQYLMLHIVHIYVPGILANSIFPPSESILREASRSLENGRRLSGVFSEPATFSVYVLGAMVLTLFNEFFERRKVFLAVYSLGILCSVSSTGILTMLAFYAIYVFVNISSLFEKINKNAKILFVLLIVAVIIILMLKSDAWLLFSYRIAGGQSASVRFEGYSFLQNFTLQDLAFGKGMNLESLDNKIYLSGFTRYVYYFGFLGLFLWVVMLLALLRNLPIEYKAFGLVFLILNLGESTMLGFVGYLFFLIICLKKNEKSYFAY